ncbi:MAG: phosphotransferase [Chloroflexi bacterium]|nr:phosphotransferase [Chloroflexota bacterium]
MGEDTPGSSSGHQRRAAAIPYVLQAWGLTVTGRPAPVAGGTLNWNYSVPTSGGPIFLRCYRQDLETERIAGEHALLEWAAARGVPAPLPRRTFDGNTILTRAAERWAVFPWIGGATIPRGSFWPAQARALGRAHGLTQAVLATHPASEHAVMPQRWDKGRSLTLLAQLVSDARAQGIAPWIVAGIVRQRELLEAFEVLPPEHFSSLPSQVLHGDFHDQQVLFDGDRVTAVVDWEIWHSDARAWEVVRSLAFSRMLGSPLMGDYLSGYREHVTLADDEARKAIQLWFQSRLTGLWAWWAYVVEHNHRVEEFFPAMIEELERAADASWTPAVVERFVRAACE